MVIRAGAVPLVGASHGGEEVLFDLFGDEDMRPLAVSWLVLASSDPPIERVVQELRRAVYGEAPASYVPPNPRELIELDLWIAPQLPVRELLAGALHDDEPGIRERAAALLGDHGTLDDLARLRRLADTEADQDVRIAALLAQRRIKRRAESPTLRRTGDG